MSCYSHPQHRSICLCLKQRYDVALLASAAVKVECLHDGTPSTGSEEGKNDGKSDSFCYAAKLSQRACYTCTKSLLIFSGRKLIHDRLSKHPRPPVTPEVAPASPWAQPELHLRSPVPTDALNSHRLPQRRKP